MSDSEETPPCRLCLETEVDELVSIFARCSSQQKLVSEMISDLSKITQYEMGENGSQYICGHCLGRLDDAWSFRKQSRDTVRFFNGQLLRNSLKNIDGCCRICEDNEPDELISVLCIYDGTLIADLLVETTDIKRPAETDRLPQNICAKCFDKLVHASGFRAMLLENNAKQQLVAQVKVEVDMTAEELFNVAEEGWSVPGVTPKVKLRQKKVPRPPEEDVDPYIYLDVPGVEGEKLQAAFSTVEEGEFCDRLFFNGTICCCGKLSETEHELLMHRELFHTVKEAAWSHLKCNDCKKRFKTKRDLTRHLEERKKKFFYRCKICNVLTKERPTMQIHFEFTRFHPMLEASEEDRKYFDSIADTIYDVDSRCCGCSEEFEDAESLLDHVKQHHYEHRDAQPMFQCTICYGSFSDRKSLMKHQQAFTGSRLYECREEYCNFRSDQRRVIRKHVETGLHCVIADLEERFGEDEFDEIDEEPTLVEFYCCLRDCHLVFDTMGELEQHCEADHAEKRSVNYHFSKEMSGGHVCNLCKRHYPTEEGYNRHIRNITDRKFSCSFCGQKFVAREKMTRHQSRAHGTAIDKPELVYPCPQCPATLKSQYTLQRHIMTQHDGVSTELCLTCGKSFRTKSLLKSHEANQHMAVRPYRCKQCPMAFGAKALLQKHTKTHTDDRPYTCSYCGKTYRHQNDCKRHEQSVHLNELNYRCDRCGKSFIRDRDLRLHMTSHTNVKLFQCLVAGCCYSTNVAKKLTAHVQEEHEMEADQSD